VKVYSCYTEGNTILVQGALSGISRAPLFKFTQKLAIDAQGKVDFDLQGNIRQDAIWLPRLGYEFTLPAESSTFRYYANGPFESYRDLKHAGRVGLFQSTAAQEYVPYVRPQEHGNHTSARWLQIGQLEFEADQMEFQVSRFSPAALTKAAHTDELVADGKTHLRIDYKVSGLGSHSCGPSLEKAYRLDEKHIRFRFALRPAKEN
jgi:beta-galactosidase